MSNEDIPHLKEIFRRSPARIAGGIEIQTDFDPTADFTAYETWDWVPAPAEEAGDPGVDDRSEIRLRGLF